MSTLSTKNRSLFKVSAISCLWLHEALRQRLQLLQLLNPEPTRKASERCRAACSVPCLASVWAPRTFWSPAPAASFQLTGLFSMPLRSFWRLLSLKSPAPCFEESGLVLFRCSRLFHLRDNFPDTSQTPLGAARVARASSFH